MTTGELKCYAAGIMFGVGVNSVLWGLAFLAVIVTIFYVRRPAQEHTRAEKTRDFGSDSYIAKIIAHKDQTINALQDRIRRLEAQQPPVRHEEYRGEIIDV